MHREVNEIVSQPRAEECAEEPPRKMYTDSSKGCAASNFIGNSLPASRSRQRPFSGNSEKAAYPTDFTKGKFSTQMSRLKVSAHKNRRIEI